MDTGNLLNPAKWCPTTIDLGKLCRVCLTETEVMCNSLEIVGHDQLINVKVADILLEICNKQVYQNDDRPYNICMECKTKAVEAVLFKRQCESSANYLHSLLFQSANIDEITLRMTNTKEPSMVPLIERIIENHSCTECNQSFSESSDLKWHTINEHSDMATEVTTLREHSCPICSQVFTLAQTLSRHIKIHQPDQKTKLCTFCGKRFLRSDDLKRHTRIHTGERPYACDQCPKSYKQSSELKEHLKSHSTMKHYVCSICGKGLATRNGLYVHMKVHRGEKNHGCKLCEKKFVTAGEMRSHMRHIHSQQKPFLCSYENCDRAFVTKLSLVTHLRAHEGEKPFQCTICTKFLATASSLSEHKLTHSGLKRKQCSICDRRLGNSQALKKHMRLHSGERPYPCEICSESFICGSTLSAHVKGKHSDTEYTCTICSERFSVLSKYRQHKLSHDSLATNQLFVGSCGNNWTENETATREPQWMVYL